MVGYAGSPTYTAYVDMTLTRSKVKVMGLLTFRQLAKPCMLAAMTASPLRGFLVNFLLRKLSREFIVRGMSTVHEFQMAIFCVLLEATVTWSERLVVLYILRILM